MTESDQTLERMSITHALEYYKNHCEFSGYSVEEEEDKFTIFCRHPTRYPLRLILLEQSAGVLAQSVYAFPERFQNDLIPIYMYANELKRLFLFLKVHIDTHENEPPILVLHSVLEEEYSRQNFAIFLDNIECDMKKFHSYPKTIDIWSTESGYNL
jgi:hypothetical protein